MDNSLTRAEISAMRRSYGEAGLETLPADPFEAFMTWLTEARANPVIVWFFQRLVAMAISQPAQFC
jgi:pyridoxamine 5'-phosphate oxidase